jgi:hypothetical protein
MYNGVKKASSLLCSFLSFLFCVFGLYSNVLREYYREIVQLPLLLLLLKEEQLEGTVWGSALVYKTIFGC